MTTKTPVTKTHMRTQNEQQQSSTGPSPLAYVIAWIIRPLTIMAVFFAVGIGGTMYFEAGSQIHLAFVAVLMVLTALWLSS